MKHFLPGPFSSKDWFQRVTELQPIGEKDKLMLNFNIDESFIIFTNFATTMI